MRLASRRSALSLPVALRNLPLPESHLGLLGVGLVLQSIRPIRGPGASRTAVDLGAGAIAGAAIAVILAATSAAGRVDLAAPDRLVTDGPYGWSRHPMYEAWTALYVAATVRLRNGWLALMLPVLLVLVHRDSGREEQRLRRRFGPDYEAYVERVPRYLTLRALRFQ